MTMIKRVITIRNHAKVIADEISDFISKGLKRERIYHRYQVYGRW